jgi:phosphate transport system substrate-binding protein
MVNLALAWAERYETVRPEVQVSVTGGGSGTGIAAEEQQTAGGAYIEFWSSCGRAGCDSRHREPQQPGGQLSLAQLADIFSGQILTGRRGEDRPIVFRGRPSGTYVYFLNRGACRPTTEAVLARQLLLPVRVYHRGTLES